MSDTPEAAILAAAISSATIEPTELHRREKPALRITLRRRRVPLDLDADVFHYFVDRHGAVQPVDVVDVPFCTKVERRPPRRR